jgi:hypothetical protein
MNAVIVSVTIHDFDKATETLRSQIVPMVSQAPGFVAGYWVTLDGREQGRGTIVMESEEAARTLAEQIHGGPAAAGDEVTLDSVQVGEVAASA